MGENGFDVGRFWLTCKCSWKRIGNGCDIFTLRSQLFQMYVFKFSEFYQLCVSVFRTKQDLFSFLLLCSVVVVVVGRKTILIYPINTSYLFSFSSLFFLLSLSLSCNSTNTNYKFSPLSYRINFFLFSFFWPTTTAHKFTVSSSSVEYRCRNQTNTEFRC